MDLILFCVFLSLSLALVALGLFRPEHTELSLIGFVFLFLLSFLIIGNDIQYKVGEITNTTYDYYNGSIINASYTHNIDIYATFTASGTLSHTFGYWLAIASVFGFIAVIIGLKRQRF